MRIRALGRDERGASLAIVAAALVVFLGMAATAVDMGMLYVARSQAQRTADAAALAGASTLAQYPGREDLARASAIDIGDRNDILGERVVVQAGDVTFPTTHKVRVWVYRTRARGNPVPTLFARILGINEVDVAVKAAAELYPGGAADCVLPLVLPDKYAERSGDPNAYDPGTDDEYIPFDPKNPDAPHTGYDENNYGDQIILRAFVNPGPANPSWYYPFRPPGSSGANDYRNGIEGKDCGTPVSIGDWVSTEPGAMIGPTKQGFNYLINLDRSAYWDTGNKCVAHPGQGCGGSPRIRPLPMFDPTQVPDPGAKPLQITNFAAVFVEDVQGNQIVGRFLGFTVPSPGSGSTGGSGGGLFTSVRLVE